MLPRAVYNFYIIYTLEFPELIMKRLPSLFLLCCLTVCASAQSINYQKSIDKALAISAKENKPLFIVVSAPVRVLNAPPGASFTTGLDAKETAVYYNDRFVNFSASIADSAGIKLRTKYNLNIFPAYVFLDSKGNLIYKDSQNSPYPDKFIGMANKVTERIESGKTLADYDQLYEKKALTALELKEYIVYREELGLLDNGPILEEYADHLSISSLNDYKTVLFLLKASPLAYGRAFNLCFANKKISDSIYKYEPVTVRSDINNHIIVYTRNEAIRTKNVQMAVNAATFARNTWGSNYREGTKTYTSNMMTFYKAVKDTTNFFRQAVGYYDGYYMTISPDSARKQQQILQDANTKRILERAQASAPAGVMVKAVPAPNSPLPTATTLNTGAWDFYSTGTKNTFYLKRALTWVKRAIELDARSSYFDTMAHIMYRLHQYDDAIANQTKAIEMAATESQTKLEQDNMRAELQKMKSNSL